MFLEKILIKILFPLTWVVLIMECITTVLYSILVNGEPKGMIVPSRGLRQGDPLSSYLFLFCAEGLNALLQNAATRGDIHGFSICRSGHKLTHLFFANDCLIFCRSTLEECNKIQELLAYYEIVSGQVINKEKTTLCFSRNTDEVTQEAIKVGLNGPAIRHYEKYLGLPSFVGKNKMACFTQIKERIWGCLQGWKEKLLSQAEREVMIKAVVQSIPVYSMSVFKLPVSLCKDIEAMIRKFWWGNGDAKKIHWLNGVHYALQNRLVVWGFGISKSLIMLYWLNRCGVLFIIVIPSSLKCLVQSTFRMVISLRLQFILDALMLGRVFYKFGMLLRKGQFGGLVMGN